MRWMFGVALAGRVGSCEPPEPPTVSEPACPAVAPLPDPVPSEMLIPEALWGVRLSLRDADAAALLPPGAFVDVQLVPHPLADGTRPPVRTLARDAVFDMVGWSHHRELDLRIDPTPHALLLVDRALRDTIGPAAELGEVVLVPSDGGDLRCDPEVLELRQWLQARFERHG